MFCSKCGANVDNDSLLCHECGAELTTNAVPQKQQDQVDTQNGNPPPPPQYTPQHVYKQQPITYTNDAPMSVGQYILIFIISSIPIVGFIMILVWAFESSVNQNKKNFARAVLIMCIIGMVIGILFAITAASKLTFSQL